MLENEVNILQNQLKTARNEINKLRQQVKNLQHVQRKDIDHVRVIIENFRCDGCRQNAENSKNSNENETKKSAESADSSAATPTDNRMQFRYIGNIRSPFAEKRGVPRQSSVGGRLRGVLDLNSDVFTNPEHALEGLAEFSHLWIIYHFHKNDAHPKAKVAPPRLSGERLGVFATRSPHRPCPIGLSLVEIEKIEGTTISFFGTDMIDGTPVLDIKPYIPFYDAPSAAAVESGRVSVGPNEYMDFYNSRQEPDGEESELDDLLSAAGNTNAVAQNDLNGLSAEASLANFAEHPPAPATAVKVPSWVVNNHRLHVRFNEHAEEQLRELREVQRQCIIDILEADPRSVYLRTKYGSQIFTFQLSQVTVTCKFDDKANTVTVVQIRPTENIHDEAA